MEKKISVIIPVYNVEEYLEKCINSVINQTYRNLEIILVDDGSTDQCPAICDEYAKKDPRIKVIHKPNGGLADARNVGLTIATGDYIGYVDSDDFVHQEMYERLIINCENNHADVGICRFHIFCDKIGSLVDNSEVKEYSNQQALFAYIDETREELITPSVWSKLFKRECVQDLQFPTGKLCEDIVYTTKAFYYAKKVVYLDQELYFYRNRPGSIMNDYTVLTRRIREEIEQYLNRIMFLQSVNEIELVKMCKYELYIRLQIRYIELLQNNMKDVEKEVLALMKNCHSDAKEIFKDKKRSMSQLDKYRIGLSLSFPQLYGFVRKRMKA